MIESRPASELTRLAFHTLQRIHAAEVEEIAQAASISDAASIADGWTLNLQAMQWQRTLPDNAPGTPT